MLEAAFWGFVGASSLLIGAVAGLWFPKSQRVIPLVMAFGAGVLIAALAFELTLEAYRHGGFDAVAVGLALGAFTFFGLDLLAIRWGGADRKRSGGQQETGAALGIVVGTVLDAIPESIAIGLTLHEGGTVSAAVVAAVFLSNIPEAMSSAAGLMKTAAHGSRAKVLLLWGTVTIVSAVFAGLGFVVFGGASENLVAGVQAFAAGAILTMLANTMMPEAFQESGRSAAIGLVTVLGFALASYLSTRK